MAEKFIAVDSGKYGTKVAEYKPSTGEVITFQMCTKVSEGDFDDDAIENETVIVEIDGQVYKIGNGARGAGAELETSKKTDIHRLCTLTALASLACESEVDDMYVAVGLPAKDWAVVSKRKEYREFILPTGEVTVRIKASSKSQIKTKKFNIKQVFAFPESIGALFMDDAGCETLQNTDITGVVDVGNLNLNLTLWQGTELLEDNSSTMELGGAILIQDLSQEITANIVPCNELITANILKSNPENRQLPTNLNLSEEQIAKSRDIISKVLKQHAEKIKRACHSKNWSLDVTRVLAIGGTSKDLENELKEVFPNITVLERSNFCNVLGYLRMLCARLPQIGIIIPFNDIISLKEKIERERKNKQSAQSNKKSEKNASVA